jgi:hypothetical protein
VTPHRMPEVRALKKLGIETPCCVSCVADELDTGEMPHEAEGNGWYIECCCTHVEALESALREGRLP